MAHAEVDDLADIFFGGGDRCDTCDSCDSPALARAGGPGEGLRRAATGCDTGPPHGGAVAEVAGCRSGGNGPQSEQGRGLSQKSQMSQGVAASPMAATPAADPDRWCWPRSDAMNSAELARFVARRDRLIRWGHSVDDAEALADRLVIRDREDDRRRLCLECSAFDRSGRCLVAARGQLPGADRRHEPVPTILQHCEGFAP